MLLENATRYQDAIRTAGERAIRRAKQAGAPVYYMDAAIADGIIRELPDGSRQRVEIREGEDIVLEHLSAAARS
jgi:hypothetical protein